jgi:hypothetical protein
MLIRINIVGNTQRIKYLTALFAFSTLSRYVNERRMSGASSYASHTTSRARSTNPSSSPRSAPARASRYGPTPPWRYLRHCAAPRWGTSSASGTATDASAELSCDLANSHAMPCRPPAGSELKQVVRAMKAAICLHIYLKELQQPHLVLGPTHVH